MERSDISNVPKYNFKLDLEAWNPNALREPLMKYRTMKEEQKFQEIELSSEFSQCESSESSDSGDINRLPTTGIHSESGVAKQSSFPKLLKKKKAPDKKFSTDLLPKVKFTPTFSPRYLSGHRKQSWTESDMESELKSIKSRKEIQYESLANMGKFILQISWMAIFIFSAASTPALLIGLPGDNMVVLMTWKLQINMLIYVPLCILELKQRGPLDLSFKTKYVKKFFSILIASIMYLLWFLGLLEACKNSIIFHATILNSLGIFIAPIMAVLWRQGMRFSPKIGLLLGFIGVGSVLYSTYAGQWKLKTNDGQVWSLKSDLLNILSSIAGFWYFSTVETLQKTIPNCTLRVILTFFSLLFAILYFVVEMNISETNNLTFNRESGMFGWVYSIPITVMMVFIISTLGWISQTFTQRQISNMLFMEPFIAQIVAMYVIQINVAPSLLSMLGGAICLAGIYIVRETYSGDFTPKTKKTIKVQEAEAEQEVKRLKKYLPQRSL